MVVGDVDDHAFRVRHPLTRDGLDSFRAGLQISRYTIGVEKISDVVVIEDKTKRHLVLQGLELSQDGVDVVAVLDD